MASIATLGKHLHAHLRHRLAVRDLPEVRGTVAPTTLSEAHDPAPVPRTAVNVARTVAPQVEEDVQATGLESGGARPESHQIGGVRRRKRVVASAEDPAIEPLVSGVRVPPTGRGRWLRNVYEHQLEPAR